jgi:hypothetical protein
MSFLSSVAQLGSALLFGAIGGGLLSAGVAWFVWRAATLRELLAEAMEISKLREAYVLEGTNFATSLLAENLNLPTTAARGRWGRRSGGLWLRQVEVRGALDAPVWNTPAQSCYGFVQGRRAWIVRNVVKQAVSYGGPEGLDQPVHPALLSSQAIEELCAWIERVSSQSPRWLFFSRHAREALRPLLIAVAGDDRIEVFGRRLSSKATSFLRWYHSNYNVR